MQDRPLVDFPKLVKTSNFVFFIEAMLCSMDIELFPRAAGDRRLPLIFRSTASILDPMSAGIEGTQRPRQENELTQSQAFAPNGIR